MYKNNHFIESITVNYVIQIITVFTFIINKNLIRFSAQREAFAQDLRKKVQIAETTVNLYVNNTTGNNDNNGLSGSSAFKTISKALLETKKFTNSSLIINVSEGDYTNEGKIVAENITSFVTIKGKDSASTFLQSIQFYYCSGGVFLDNLTFSYALPNNNALVRYRGCNGSISNCVFDGKSVGTFESFGVTASEGGKIQLVSCVFNNLWCCFNSFSDGVIELYFNNKGSNNEYLMTLNSGIVYDKQPASISYTNKTRLYSPSIPTMNMENISTGYILSHKDGTFSIGSASNRFNNITLVNSPIVSSDMFEKTGIRTLDIDTIVQLVMAIDPVEFARYDGAGKHYGFLAQQIEYALRKVGIDPSTFGGLVIAEPLREVETGEYEEQTITDVNGNEQKIKVPIMKTVKDREIYCVRYEELIALLIAFVQEIYRKNAILEDRVICLEKAYIQKYGELPDAESC